jgi:hypothetical protein
MESYNRTKAVYPAPGMGNFEVQRHVQYICLELLLSFVNDMASRALDVRLRASLMLLIC